LKKTSKLTLKRFSHAIMTYPEISWPPAVVTPHQKQLKHKSFGFF